jgi:CRP-like cAMP-binding protein
VGLDADVRLLSGVRPFDALPREAVQLIAFSCARRRLKAGDILFNGGDEADGAFFVLDGEIVLRAKGATRRVALGGLIGESALMTETLRPSDAAAADGAELLHIPRETFRRVLSEFPESAAKIAKGSARRARALIGRLEAIQRRSFPAEGSR